MPFTQGIALGQNQDGRLELMATIRADDPDLPDGVWRVREAREDPGWPPQWESLGVALDSGFGGPAPAIARNMDDRLEVVVTSADALLHSWQTEPNGDQWHHDSLGRPPETVPTSASPALTRNQDGRMEVFVLANAGLVPFEQTGQLWNIRQDTAAPGGWSSWLFLGSPATPIRNRPAVAVSRDGRLDVFLEGDPATVQHIRQDPTGQDGWSNWGGVGNSPGRPQGSAGGGTEQGRAPRGVHARHRRRGVACLAGPVGAGRLVTTAVARTGGWTLLQGGCRRACRRTAGGVRRRRTIHRRILPCAQHDLAAGAGPDRRLVRLETIRPSSWLPNGD